LLTADGKISGETGDISLEGAFVHCRQLLRQNDTILLTIRAPHGYLKVVAEVVWTAVSSGQEHQNVSGVGLHFLWV